MATVLPTITTLTIVAEAFTLLTEYSGEQNPHIFYDVFFTVTDGVTPLQFVNIVIGEDTYLTDINGQVTISLNRGDYTADISLVGYESQVVNFTDIIQNITLVAIGSYDDSYDDSYER